ncbi:unnamed protein product [Timema podura]|uniref:Uncharacterized protein n=1 Tax=Timema podura TaxID=61482 RepID=A0ABN7P9N6_TIMPD|nr:unnamed protein product [Timema podura]
MEALAMKFVRSRLAVMRINKIDNTIHRSDGTERIAQHRPMEVVHTYHQQCDVMIFNMEVWAPTATKNFKMMSRVILVDDSIDATKMFFRLHIFYGRHDEPPKIECNHILRVHRMQVEKFNNGVDGRVFRTTDLLTFSPNPDDQDNIFSTAKTFELTVSDVVKNKDNILRALDTNTPQTKKLWTADRDINKALLKWFTVQRSLEVAINGPVLKKKLSS